MKKVKVVVIGSTGQLGYDLVRVAPDAVELVALSHKDIELRDHAHVAKMLEGLKPDHVIDLAAFHKTDVCEDEIETTFAVNCHAAHGLALACERLGACLTYMSTDYVFSGHERSPRVETNATDPINVYGVSKRAGESMVQTYAPRHFIFRVSGLYGVAGSSGKGSNFVELMIRLAREEKPIRVVLDQTLTPTSTIELASKLWEVILNGRHGLYHCTNVGQCSWHTFAAEIFRQMELNPALSPQTTADSGVKAPRPEYSVLDNSRLRAEGFIDMQPWQLALNGYLVDKHGAKRM